MGEYVPYFQALGEELGKQEATECAEHDYPTSHETNENIVMEIAHKKAVARLEVVGAVIEEDRIRFWLAYMRGYNLTYITRIMEMRYSSRIAKFQIKMGMVQHE